MREDPFPGCPPSVIRCTAYRVVAGFKAGDSVRPRFVPSYGMERREFLKSSLLGGAAAVLGVKASANDGPTELHSQTLVPKRHFPGTSKKNTLPYEVADYVFVGYHLQDQIRI